MSLRKGQLNLVMDQDKLNLILDRLDLHQDLILRQCKDNHHQDCQANHQLGHHKDCQTNHQWTLRHHKVDLQRYWMCHNYLKVTDLLKEFNFLNLERADLLKEFNFLNQEQVDLQELISLKQEQADLQELISLKQELQHHQQDYHQDYQQWDHLDLNK